MRIIKLNTTTERMLFKRREIEDFEALKIASRIVSDVRARGDEAVVAVDSQIGPRGYFEKGDLGERSGNCRCTEKSKSGVSARG